MIDKRVKECAVQLKDRNLLAKLAAAGDMLALEAKYHSCCLASLYNRYRKMANTNSDKASGQEKCLHRIAFAEIISYIEEFFEERNTISNVPSLRLADLAKMYMTKLEELGVDTSRVNTTRLKERILSTLPHVSAHPQGRDIVLVLDRDVGGAIKLLNDQDTDVEAMHLVRAAKVIRKDILKQNQSFKGTFDTDCQENAIPQSLKALINFILRGPGTQRNTAIKKSVEVNETQASRSISQLIIYNTTIRQAKTPQNATRHKRERETPLPIYVALKIHGLTRGRGLIDALFNLGLCISYDRVLSISTDIANAVCERFDKDGVVCPPVLRSGIFTTAGFDNIDHNPSSTTSRDSFHGTAISLIQHPTKQTPGTVATFIDGRPQKEREISSLPSQFSDVQPLVLLQRDLSPPPLIGQLPDVENVNNYAYKKEDQWLLNVKELMRKEKLESDDNISWAAYHASNERELNYEPAITSLMSLFLENAHSAPMILRGMNVIRSAVELVNPGQTPVIAMDQPLFALAKQIQWQCPHTHGEDKLLVMFGGLHIEMAVLRTLGNYCIIVIIFPSI